MTKDERRQLYQSCPEHRAMRQAHNRAYKERSREKVNALTRARYAADPDKWAAAGARYRFKNAAKVKERKRRRYLANKEASRKQLREWRKANPEQARAQVSLRSRRVRQATPKCMTREQRAAIKQIYVLAQELQWLSEEKLTVDHIIPLAGECVSGLHVAGNLQILPASANSRKSNKLASINY